MRKKTKAVHHIKSEKIIDSRANKPHSDGIPKVSPYATNTIKEKKKPDAYVVHTFSPACKIFLFTLSAYFLAKLYFLLYNSGYVINILFPDVNGYH